MFAEFDCRDSVFTACGALEDGTIMVGWPGMIVELIANTCRKEALVLEGP